MSFFTDIQPALIDFGLAMATAGVSWATVKYHQSSNANIQATNMATITDAAKLAAGNIVARSNDSIDSAVITPKDPIIQIAVADTLGKTTTDTNPLASKTPDNPIAQKLTEAGVTPDVFGQMITGALGILQMGVAGPIPAAVANVAEPIFNSITKKK